MNKELSVDVVSMADLIRDKVRTAIVLSIPDAQVDGLVKKEWETFFLTPSPRNSYDQTPQYSPFALMVRKEIEKYITEKVTEAVRKELDAFNQSIWDNQGKRVVSEIVKSYSPAALEGMAAAVVQSTLERMNQNRPY